jgi:hypothetical protein
LTVRNIETYKNTYDDDEKDKKMLTAVNKRLKRGQTDHVHKVFSMFCLTCITSRKENVHGMTKNSISFWTWFVVGVLRQLRSLGIFQKAVVEPDLTDKNLVRLSA